MKRRSEHKKTVFVQKCNKNSSLSTPVDLIEFIYRQCRCASLVLSAPYWDTFSMGNLSTQQRASQPTKPADQHQPDQMLLFSRIEDGYRYMKNFKIIAHTTPTLIIDYKIINAKLYLLDSFAIAISSSYGRSNPSNHPILQPGNYRY